MRRATPIDLLTKIEMNTTTNSIDPLAAIADLIEISRFYGADKRFVIAGGGNTSYKSADKLWVKASGSSLATINEDGTPHLVPIWYMHDGRDLLLITRPTSRKVRNLRRDPRVTICIDRPTPPYAGVVANGIAELEDVAYQELAVPMAVRYLGVDAGTLVGAQYAAVDLTTIRIRIDRMFSWDYSRPD